jgi:uncharacterized membrane protein
VRWLPLLVSTIGAIVHRPLSQVPENTLKFGVGAMLTTFGIFWASEGVGVEWPAADGAIIGILAFVLLCGLVMTQGLRRQAASARSEPVLAAVQIEGSES